MGLSICDACVIVEHFISLYIELYAYICALVCTMHYMLQARCNKDQETKNQTKQCNAKPREKSRECSFVCVCKIQLRNGVQKLLLTSPNIAIAHPIHMEHPQSIIFSMSHSIHSHSGMNVRKKRRETLLHILTACEMQRETLGTNTATTIHTHSVHECVSIPYFNVNVGKQTAKHIQCESGIACVLRQFSRLSTVGVVVFVHWKDTNSMFIPYSIPMVALALLNQNKQKKTTWKSEGES